MLYKIFYVTVYMTGIGLSYFRFVNMSYNNFNAIYLFVQIHDVI